MQVLFSKTSVYEDPYEVKAVGWILINLPEYPFDHVCLM